MKYESRFLTLGGMILSTALIGCGSAESRNAPHNPLATAEKVRTFEPKNTDLFVNALFLWKESVTPKQVSEMGASTRKFVNLKILLAKREDLRGKEAQILEGLEKVKQGLGQIAEGLKQVGAGLGQVQAGIGAAEKAKEAEEELLRKDPARSRDTLNGILAQLQALEGQKAGLLAKRGELEQQSRGVEAQKNDLEGKLGQIQGGLAQIAEKLRLAIGDKDPAQVLQALQTQVFPQYSERFASPLVIRVRFDAAANPTMTIAGWDLQDGTGAGPRTFSSGTGIRNVEYQPRGGVLTFEVDLGTEETFSFECSRSNYEEAAKNGLVMYYVNIKRTDVKSGKVRLGTGTFAGQ